MTKSKNKERAKTYIYRNGIKLSVAKLKKEDEDKKLKAIGLARAKPAILTPDQIWKERRPVDA